MTEPMIKFFTELGVLSITGILSIFIVMIRKKIKENFVILVKIIKQLKEDKEDHHISKKDVDRDVRVQDILAETRVAAKADRCYVLQFHNGNLFNTKNQMWRLSCTHESVSTGIRPSIGVLQNILSSSISDLLFVLWQEDLSGNTGIKRISPESCNCSTKNNCRLPKGVYLRIINELPEGYSKGLLMSSGIKFMLSSPLLDAENNRIGILLLDYCWEDSNVTEITMFAEQLCQTASRISFDLRKDS